MTLSSILLFVGLSSAAVLNRIASTTLRFDDEQCVNATFVPTNAANAAISQCLGVTFSSTLSVCIPSAATNCLIKGQVGNANLTALDQNVRLQWLASAVGAGGIVTVDTTADNKFLGSAAQRIGTSNLRTTGAVGFVNVGATITRKLRALGGNPDLVVDKRAEYEFSFDACSQNVTTTNAFVTLTVSANTEGATTLIPVKTATLTLPANDTRSSCGRLTMRVPHYDLFAHIGVRGFVVALSAAGGVGDRIFLDNVAVSALSIVNAASDTDCTTTGVVTVTPPIGSAPACTRVFVNEIRHSDAPFVNATGLITDFVEIVGPVGTVLANARISFVNFLAGNTFRRVDVDFDEANFVIVASTANATFGSITIGVPEGLGNGTDGIGIDGVAFFANKNDALPVQFVCYGNQTVSQAGLSPVPGLGPCSATVDLNNFNVTAAGVQSIQLVGCGECYQDFDWGFGPASFEGSGSSFAISGAFANPLQSFCTDADNDGFWNQGCCFGTGNDCGDNAATQFPGANEVCDGLDSNCDGVKDASELDTDLDGRIPCDGDCDDNDVTVFGVARFFVDGKLAVVPNNCLLAALPANTNNSQLEQCDNKDNDCDADVDEAFPKVLHFRDEDQDGFAGVSSSLNVTQEFPNCQVIVGCVVTFPFKWSPNRTDCDDNDPNVHPDGGPFLCRQNDTCETSGSKVDNNCNGIFDEKSLVDVDRDGFANETASFALTGVTLAIDLQAACPLYLPGDLTDCNDNNAAINPNATEICNKIDDNCINGIDEGQFIDIDQDGFGNAAASNASCAAFYPGFFNDCNDTNPDVKPNATEIFCDGIDNDCNPATPNSKPELCDGVDTDCNCGQSNAVGFVRNNASGLCFSLSGNVDIFVNDNGFLTDADTDSFFDFVGTCGSRVKDCNDNNDAIKPLALETCNKIDDNCNGEIDEGLITDNDQDGFSAVINSLCNGLYGTVADCDDANPAVNANATEDVCDNIDNNCDGIGAGTLTSILIDQDGDKFFTFDLTTLNGTSCNARFAAVLPNGDKKDCNDANALVRPCNATGTEDVCIVNGDVRAAHEAACIGRTTLCGREIAGSPIVADGLDNDCNSLVDDIADKVAFLKLDFVSNADRRRHASTSTTSSSLSSSDECEDLVVTLENLSKTISVENVVVKGQLTLPPKGSLQEYIFGDLVNFGVKVDSRTLRVVWVQFSLKAGEKAKVKFPVCVTHREDFDNVVLQLKLDDFVVVNAPLSIISTRADTSITAKFD